LAKKLISNGHNLVLTGQGGTGKTYTIQSCYEQLRISGKRVQLTCYRGIACRQYHSSVGAITLHRFYGLEDGQHSNADLLNLITYDDKFINTKQRIIETEVLIIDEVSMVSKKIFEQAEYICRKIKDPAFYFGGIQVILSGDFFQLPPIQDELYGDFGHYCFEITFFQYLFPHRINLSKIYRQSEIDLSNAVSELENGERSEETNNFMNSLNREIDVPEGETVVKLFVRNLDVDFYNSDQLETINAYPLHCFQYLR
jgi:ATP-dependent DNA helicase PIF1